MLEPRRVIWTALVMLTAAVALGCNDDESSVECIAVDPQIGDPIDRQWCDGEYYPSITWEGEVASRLRLVCLPPETVSHCRVCPAYEVREMIEAALYAELEQFVPQCKVQHWELGCMRTIENAKLLNGEDDPNICCFQTAIWGPGCEY